MDKIPLKRQVETESCFKGVLNNESFCRKYEKKLAKISSREELHEFLEYHHPFVGSSFVVVDKSALSQQSATFLSRYAHVMVIAKPEWFNAKSEEKSCSVEWQKVEHLGNLAYLSLHSLLPVLRAHYLGLFTEFQKKMT